MCDMAYDKLRSVFDICDQSRQGYITVEHFAGLAKEHFGAERTSVSSKCFVSFLKFISQVYFFNL